MRDPEIRPHAVTRDGNTIARHCFEKQHGGGIEDAELPRRVALGFGFPERVEKALRAVGVSLFDHHVHDGPEVIATAGRVHAGRFQALLLVMALQSMRGILTCVAPAAIQSRAGQPLVACLQGNRRQHDTGKLRCQTRVLFHREVEVFMRDKGGVAGKTARFPNRDGAAPEIGVLAGVEGPVLVQNQPVRVDVLDELVDFDAERPSQESFVAHAVGGQRNVTAVVRDQFLQVPDRIEGEGLGRIVAIIGQFRLHEDPGLIGSLEVLRQLAVGVQADVEKPGLPGRLEMPQVLFARSGGDEGQRIHEVVPVAPHKERLVVEKETLATNLQSAHAEPLHPAVNRLVAVTQDQFGEVQRGRIRRPRLKARQRNSAGKLGCLALRIKLDVLGLVPRRLAVAGLERYPQHRLLQQAEFVAVGHGCMNLGRLAVEISADPCVVYPRVGRGFQFNVPIETAKAVRAAEQTLPAGQDIVDLGHDNGLRPG